MTCRLLQSCGPPISCPLFCKVSCPVSCKDGAEGATASCARIVPVATNRSVAINNGTTRESMTRETIPCVSGTTRPIGRFLEQNVEFALIITRVGRPQQVPFGNPPPRENSLVRYFALLLWTLVILPQSGSADRLPRGLPHERTGIGFQCQRTSHIKPRLRQLRPWHHL